MRFFESLRKRRDQIRVDLVNPANLLADYFAGAMYAHLFKDDENARGAAFTAGVVSSSLQRSGMIVFVQQLSLSLKSDPDMKDLGDAASREVMASKLDILAQQLSSRDWTNGDRNDARRHLERIDPEYGRAMSGGPDPVVFMRRYPDLPLTFTGTLPPPAILNGPASIWSRLPDESAIAATVAFLRREYPNDWNTRPYFTLASKVAIQHSTKVEVEEGRPGTPIFLVAQVAVAAQMKRIDEQVVAS